MKNDRRRILMANRDIQHSLIRRAVCYWMLCAIAAGELFICWLLLPQMPRALGHFIPVIFAFNVLLFPVMYVDLLRLSNRFVGPTVQLKRKMQQLANGEPVDPILLRKDDHWQDFAADFNKFLAHLQTDANPAVADRRVERDEQVAARDVL